MLMKKVADRGLVRRSETKNAIEYREKACIKTSRAFFRIYPEDELIGYDREPFYRQQNNIQLVFLRKVCVRRGQLGSFDKAIKRCSYSACLGEKLVIKVGPDANDTRGVKYNID